MMPETLNALIRAGGDALQTTCGLTVTRAHVSLVRQGDLTFPSLGELRIRNGTAAEGPSGIATRRWSDSWPGLAGGSGHSRGWRCWPPGSWRS